MMKAANKNVSGNHFRGVIRRTSIWDKLVFKKVQDGMGGRLRLLVVGSAPLAGNVLTFMRAALGCVVSWPSQWLWVWPVFFVEHVLIAY